MSTTWTNSIGCVDDKPETNNNLNVFTVSECIFFSCFISILAICPLLLKCVLAKVIQFLSLRNVRHGRGAETATRG